jgi:topoisomerase IA-like protein
MPFKSKAQRRKFAELLVNGKISPETYEEWNRETGGSALPERVEHKGKRKPVKRKTAKRKTAKRKTAKRKTAKRKTAKRKTGR